MTIAAAIRLENVASSRLLRQRKGAAMKNRSIDMYGAIISGTKGMSRSHSKKSVPTSLRCDVNQLVQP
jgi:hypothetical protein